MSDDPVPDSSSTPLPGSNTENSNHADVSAEGARAEDAYADETQTARARESPAISDDTVRRYYYIYDSRAGRPMVQDRLTQAPYVWDDDPRAPVLRHVASATSPETAPCAVDRRFALWCARQVTEAFHKSEIPTGPIRTDAPRGVGSTAAIERAAEFVEAAEVLVETPGSEPAESVRAAAENTVIHATTIGLSEMDPSAAALLTAFGATHPQPRTAALEAAHMSERYAEFVAYHRQHGADIPLPSAVSQRQDHRLGSSRDSLVPDAAARLMREAQIDWLLDEA